MCAEPIQILSTTNTRIILKRERRQTHMISAGRCSRVLLRSRARTFVYIYVYKRMSVCLSVGLFICLAACIRVT